MITSSACRTSIFSCSLSLPTISSLSLSQSGRRIKGLKWPIATTVACETSGFIRIARLASPLGEYRRGQGQPPSGSSRHRKFARRAGFELVGTYYDESVKGSDPVDTRPAFAEMLEVLKPMARRPSSSRAPTVSPATSWSSRLATPCSRRGHRPYRGVARPSFVEDTPTAVLMRQVLGAFAEFDKTTLVAKLRGLGTASVARASRSRDGSRLRRHARRRWI